MDFASRTYTIFHPLAKKCDLAIVEKKSSKVKFFNNTVSLSIMYDANISYEISVGISNILKAGKSRGFSLNEILEWQGMTPLKTLQAMPEDPKFDELLKYLKNECEKACFGLLKGDQSAFRELEKFRLEKGESYAQILRETHLYQDVEKAWVSKDYSSIISMLSSNEFSVPIDIQKKLFIAKKKLRVE